MSARDEAMVSLTPAGRAAVEMIIGRALEIRCPKCDAEAGHDCDDDPAGIHMERVRASTPLKIECPKCEAPVGVSCFELSVSIHPERKRAYAEAHQ